MKDIFVNFKKTGIISVCFLSSLLSGYSQRIIVSPIIPGGGSGTGGSATNAVATIRKDGTPIVNGATIIDFTNAAGTVVTVTADGTTARVGIPQGGGGGGSLITNANQFGASTNLTIKDGVLLTNAAFYGDLTSVGDAFFPSVVRMSNNVIIAGDLSLPNYANVADTLDLVGGKQQGSFILTNFLLMGISNIASANANIVVTTNSGVLVLTGSAGGSSGTNFNSIIVTNVIQRQVLWTTTTNLTIDWNGPDEIIWAPTGVTASLAMTGNPGNLTNAVSKILKLRLTDSGTTSITWPTNGIDGLAPYVLTAPSTNEYALIYDGQTFRIASYQSPSTGIGEVIVVNTNPSIYLGQFPTNAFLRTGAGGIITTGAIGNGLSITDTGTLSAPPRTSFMLTSGGVSDLNIVSNTVYYWGPNANQTALTDITFDSGMARRIRAPRTGTIKAAWGQWNIVSSGGYGSANAITFHITNLTAATRVLIGTVSASNMVRMASSSSLAFAVSSNDLLMMTCTLPATYTNPPPVPLSSMFFNGGFDLE